MGEIVLPDAGMGVETEKRLVFFREAEHELGKQRVLEYIREIAGVKKVTVSEHGLKTGFGIQPRALVQFTDSRILLYLTPNFAR